MKKWKLIAGIALVFILGALAGSIGTALVHRHRFERFVKDPAERRTVFLEKLTRELRLTPAQQEAFKTIIDETDQKRNALFQKRHAEIKMFVEESFARMKERLDPEQQKRLENMRRRHLENRKKRPRKPPPP